MFYKTIYGYYLEKSDVEKAFLITTGKFASHDPIGFMRYLNSIWGKYIVETCNPTIEDLITHDNKILAIKKYRKDNDCSLMEAKTYVDNLCEKLKNA
jgi:hypothetical protein